MTLSVGLVSLVREASIRSGASTRIDNWPFCSPYGRRLVRGGKNAGRKSCSMNQFSAEKSARRVFTQANTAGNGSHGHGTAMCSFIQQFLTGLLTSPSCICHGDAQRRQKRAADKSQDRQDQSPLNSQRNFLVVSMRMGVAVLSPES